MNRLALTMVALMVGGAALAQPPQGGFGGQGGGRGGRGGGFPGGGGPGGMMGGPGMMGGMMNREVSAANIGLRIMASYLDLTEAQVGKIALIREEAQDAMRPQVRRPQRNSNAEGEGGPPDFQAMMQEMQASMQKAERKATTDTAALLSDAQSSRLKLLVKALKGLQDSGIRPEAALKLQLSDSQLTKLAQGNKPESVLSSEQQTIAQSFQAPMGRGGPGGPGGPGGGGFPGGPPPGGGFGGPGGGG